MATTGAAPAITPAAEPDWCGAVPDCTPLPDATAVSWRLSTADGPQIWSFTPSPDVTGDGLADVLVVGPEGLYVAEGPARPRDPRLDAIAIVSGVSNVIATGDVDGDGTAEVFVLETDQRPAQLSLKGVSGAVAVDEAADWTRTEIGTGLAGQMIFDDLDQDGQGDLLITGLDEIDVYRGPLPRAHGAVLPAPTLAIGTSCDGFEGENVSILEVDGARKIQLHETTMSSWYSCPANSQQALVDGAATGAVTVPSTDPNLQLSEVLDMGVLVPDLTGDGVDERAFMTSAAFSTVSTSLAPLPANGVASASFERTWTTESAELGPAAVLGASAPSGARLVAVTGDGNWRPEGAFLSMVPAGSPSGSLVQASPHTVGLGNREVVPVGIGVGLLGGSEDSLLVQQRFYDADANGTTYEVFAIDFVAIR